VKRIAHGVGVRGPTLTPIGTERESRAAGRRAAVPTWVLAIGAAVGVLTGFGLFDRRRPEWSKDPLRRRRQPALARVAPVVKAAFVEGRSEDPRIGVFAGFVFAKARFVPAGEPERAASTRYWLHDRSTPRLVWVRPHEIARCCWPDGADGVAEADGDGQRQSALAELPADSVEFVERLGLAEHLIRVAGLEVPDPDKTESPSAGQVEREGRPRRSVRVPVKTSAGWSRRR
jgi:hypothetical protein